MPACYSSAGLASPGLNKAGACHLEDLGSQLGFSTLRDSSSAPIRVDMMTMLRSLDVFALEGALDLAKSRMEHRV